MRDENEAPETSAMETVQEASPKKPRAVVMVSPTVREALNSFASSNGYKKGELAERFIREGLDRMSKPTKPKARATASA